MTRYIYFLLAALVAAGTQAQNDETPVTVLSPYSVTVTKIITDDTDSVVTVTATEPVTVTEAITTVIEFETTTLQPATPTPTVVDSNPVDTKTFSAPQVGALSDCHADMLEEVAELLADFVQLKYVENAMEAARMIEELNAYVISGFDSDILQRLEPEDRSKLDKYRNEHKDCLNKVAAKDFPHYGPKTVTTQATSTHTILDPTVITVTASGSTYLSTFTRVMTSETAYPTIVVTDAGPATAKINCLLVGMGLLAGLVGVLML